MSKLIKRQVYYFDEPGHENTQMVVEAVYQRLAVGGIRRVIVASVSGRTAVEFAHSL